MYFKDFPQMLYDFKITNATGEGTQATAVANIAGGGVISANIINGGSGYTTANVTFSAPQTTGVTASGRAVIVNGVVTGIVITCLLYTSPSPRD